MVQISVLRYKVIFKSGIALKIAAIVLSSIFFLIVTANASFPPCEGDFNADRDLDGQDLALFAASFNQINCNEDCNGDFYQDGDVDSQDLGIVATDFGRSGCTPVSYKVYGLNFSPYQDSQDPNYGSTISEEQIYERLQAIQPYTRWIRSFGMTDGLEETGRIAHGMNLKVAAGAWLGTDSSVNSRQMNNLISAAQSGHVDLAIIGSEVLLRNDMSENELLAYINQFRTAVPDVPVTTADVYSVFLAHPDLIAACDVVLVNYYPYWEGKSVETSIARIHALHQEVMMKSGGKEIIVSETGWPTDGDTIGEAVPSMDNACFYNLNFVSWAQAEHVKYFLFEAFDEAWKALYEGPQGAHWGVWDKNAVLKDCMSPIFEAETLPDTWTCTQIPGGEGEPEIQLTDVPPYGSSQDLKGQVWHVPPADYKIAVYIRVGSGWWTKPYFANPLTDIDCDGAWTCDITTGGNDSKANAIKVFLLPGEYLPPSSSGQATLPDEIYSNCTTFVEVTR